MQIGEKINALSEKLPKKESYNLSSQICCAPDSVALNILEGPIVKSNTEFRKFLGYSARSLAKLVTCLHKCKLRKYIQENEFLELYDDAF